MTPIEKISAALAEGQLILIDGGVGTEIERLGGGMVEGAWCGVASVTDPEIVQSIHASYLQLGARVSIANNYASSRYLLSNAGWEDRVEEVNRQGIQLALDARSNTGLTDTVVAGTISTTPQDRPIPPLDVLEAHLRESAQIQTDAGAELMMLEMMRRVEHTDIALRAAKVTGLPIWIGWSCDGTDENGPILVDSGEALDDAIRWTVAQGGVDAICIMHTQTDEIEACIDVVKRHWDGPIGVYAHTGIFEPPHWIFEGTISPTDYSAAVQGWIAQGVQILGGCCGIGPAHIREMSEQMSTDRA